MVSNSSSSQHYFTVVSQSDAKVDPYPYVYVNHDGSVRELGPDERKFLETPFLPMDGGRPALKDSYDSKNGWGSISGFCKRSLIPPQLDIQSAEPEDSDLTTDL